MEQLLALGAVSGSLLAYIYDFIKPWFKGLNSNSKFVVIVLLDFLAAVAIVVWQGDFTWSNAVSTLIAVFAAAETVYQKFLKQLSE